MKRIVILLLFSFSCTQRNNNENVSINNADSLIARMEKDVTTYLRNEQYDKSKKILDSISPYIDKANYYPLTCSWLGLKSRQAASEENFDSARIYINEGLKIAIEKDSTKKTLAKLQLNFAELLKEQNSYDSALRYAKEAYYLAKKVDTTLLPKICYRLYEIYAVIGDVNTMRNYLFEGMHYAKDQVFHSLFASGISDYYATVNNIDSSMYYFREFQKDPGFSNPYFTALKYANIGMMFYEKGNSREAIKYQLMAFNISPEIVQYNPQALINLGMTYIDLNQFSKADYYLDSTLRIFMKKKDWEWIQQTWKQKANNYAAQQKYRDAYLAMDSVNKYYKRAVDSSLAAKAKELETKYAVRTKDEKIKSLAFENATAQKIANQRRIINITLIAVGLLLLVIGLLLWRRKQMQLQLREAGLQQQQLRSEMEPHFIFNTLSVLQGFIRNDEKENAIQYLNKTAKLLRLSFENARESFVPLQKEINALESYLKLQMMTFENLFKYTISVYDSYEDDNLLIPPMLLQPFVENSILHGFKNLNRKGLITIQINRNDDVLHCVIDDNGHGFQDSGNSKTERISSSIITQERLSILTKQLRKKAKLVITNKETINEGEGVRIELDIPYKLN